MSAKFQIDKNTPVFFRSLPKTEQSKPNAVFLRDKGDVNGVAVAAIQYSGDEWVVRYSEILPVHSALAAVAKQWDSKLKELPSGATKVQKAEALGVSVGTLKKRLKMIQEHLPRSEQSK